jgi:hypothetical protein
MLVPSFAAQPVKAMILLVAMGLVSNLRIDLNGGRLPRLKPETQQPSRAMKQVASP